MRRILFFIAAILISVQLNSQNITNYTFIRLLEHTQRPGGTTMNLSGGGANEGILTTSPSDSFIIGGWLIPAYRQGPTDG
jgi:hypothetical protein